MARAYLVARALDAVDGGRAGVQMTVEVRKSESEWLARVATVDSVSARA
jgi:hypothetical protein